MLIFSIKKEFIFGTEMEVDHFWMKEDSNITGKWTSGPFMAFNGVISGLSTKIVKLITQIKELTN